MSPFEYTQLNPFFLRAMVQAMFREEKSQKHNPELLTTREMYDLYWAYMGFPR